MPVLIEHLWDINHLLHENGIPGGIVKGLFGYNGNPSLIEAASWSLYLILAVFLWKRKET